MDGYQNSGKVRFTHMKVNGTKIGKEVEKRSKLKKCRREDIFLRTNFPISLKNSTFYINTLWYL